MAPVAYRCPMAADLTTRPVARDGAAGQRAVGLAVAVACGLGVWATWAVFVAGRTGRLLDLAVWQGAEYGRTRLWQVAEPVLEVVSVPFIGGVLVATMLLALLRRRAALALRVALLMGGANLTTQVLKRWVLDRPDLGLGDLSPNSLPSGHTTAAASVSAALVLVVPRRLRPAAAVLGALYTTATGVSTLVGGWHRPSDVVAAVLVVLGWAALATTIGVRAERAQDVAGGPVPRRGATLAVGLLTAGGLVGVVMATGAMVRCLALLDGGIDDRAELLLAYAGGAAGVGAAACLGFAALLVLVRGVDRAGV